MANFLGVSNGWLGPHPGSSPSSLWSSPCPLGICIPWGNSPGWRVFFTYKFPGEEKFTCSSRINFINFRLCRVFCLPAERSGGTPHQGTCLYNFPHSRTSPCPFPSMVAAVCPYIVVRHCSSCHLNDVSLGKSLYQGYFYRWDKNRITDN